MRLTKRNDTDNGYFYPYCFDKCGGNGSSENCDYCEFQEKTCEKLGTYEDAEEQGLLLRIDCHCKDCKYVNFDGCLNTTCYCRKNGCFMQIDDFCKYATKEEAEQALKQMGE